MMETESDIYDDPSSGQKKTSTVLYLAFRANDPMTLPSRHVVSDIDVIQFGRGDGRVTRERRDGLRRLHVTAADPLMSTNHGHLVRARGTWMLDDPSSKNGAIVRGERTRASPIADGDVFALGHTLFMLSTEEVDDSPLDRTGAELQPPVPELATFVPHYADAIARLARLAKTELPMLLLGETGTGKEVAARALHELSQRRGAFVAINCGAIASTLVESELFGHKRGAFSGATSDKVGYVRAADQGTLFLDEIGELPSSAQTALLRVLQEREVVPVGDSTPISVDLRVCAATHRDLAKLVDEGTFREDLFARLIGVTITLPPLRRRKPDLGLLVPALLRRLPRAQQTKFSPAAALRMFDYDWPRNVRELERVLAVMTALAGKQPIGIEHVPEDVRTRAPDPAPAIDSPAVARTVTPSNHVEPSLTDEERKLKEELEQLLRAHDHNLAEVARRLGKDRTQIYRWVRRFGIEREGGT